jgi:signal transduction histidine kinase
VSELPSADRPADALQADAIRAAKLQAMAEFAAGAGHEINNPVAAIVGRVQMLLDGEEDVGRRQMLAQIGAQALRIRDMIGDAMLFARPPEPSPEPFDLAAAAPAMLEPLRGRFTEAGVRLDVPSSSAAENPVPIHADPTQVAVVLTALARNALEACEPGGTVRVTLARADRNGAAIARIVVEDNGTGLTELEREHLFDPFFSGRQAGRGLGFGLPKCWRIVTQHGGHIDVETPNRGGCRFTIDWPAASEHDD